MTLATSPQAPEIFSAAAFFADQGPPAPELFPAGAPVWEGLRGLKDWLEQWHYPAWTHKLGVADGPLPKTMVIYRPEQGSGPATAPVTVIPGEECEITYGSADKGALQVSRGGELLDGASVLMAGTVIMGRRFELGRGVLVESGAFLKEPLVIGDHCEIRQGAYLRGHCLIGRRCVVGHVTEVKHTIFCDDAKAGHFAYLGDSILGPGVNLGAGTKLANLRFAAGEVRIRYPGGQINSGLKKLGAVLGAGCQTGCNAVTNPGTLLGRGSVIMPNTTAPAGYHPPRTMIRQAP
ncbi:bifunctional GlmU protein [Desulfurivibrio alkaliphilus]|uniref:Bifunctional GlmU protein n=1 Tax=Desulfurivibrio alkaliphilus (strain DSM 19089 / UNIQEM U267 / AHT2) TaxID=589865 RepID=D6Z6E4_DESAT|nr:bifunctional GlmU protein [Desulfurivibrio alkaliphilus]ADH86909.1 bifunctional GlmU protein [Desulfurivibrio alkaliphilus AHT 2]